MSLYQSRPSQVEAVHWDGKNTDEMIAFCGEKVSFGQPGTFIMRNGQTNEEMLLFVVAGKDGAQETVPVPVGHWLVCQPGDKSDIWPVEDEYFNTKYYLVT